MQRIAVPMIGGMVSSTLLTLVVLPAVYGIVKEFGLRRSEHFTSQEFSTSGSADMGVKP
jgi:Cu(I)/Ag(I) efflux system membrane protein CusA/SilA